MSGRIGSFQPGLEVRVYGELVGRLTRDPHGTVRFIPSRDWLDRDQRPPLGLAFLRNPTPRPQPGNLPVWFENLLPERDSVLRRWICRQHGIRDHDSAALLPVLGRDLPGAVEVVGDVAVDVADDTLSSEEAGPEKLRFSLAGVQLKLSMLLDGDRFSLAAKDQIGRWIVKIPGSRFPDLPDVEATTMAWARAAGLPTPANHVLPIAVLQGVDPTLIGEPTMAFAVERFDRRPDGRVHQEDFAQALEIRPKHKYGEPGRAPTYDSLTRLVGDVCGAKAKEDFVRRVAFVVASGNGDAHLKNWSFQWGQDHRPWLNPCYDQVATIAWTGMGWSLPEGPELALSLGKTRRFAELNRGRVRRFAERAGDPASEAIFLDALENARAAWAAHRDDAPERMRIALDEHWRRVPLLHEVGGA